ncbi:MAG: CehA/McbA family metallohydrolase [bacterium]
MVGRSEVWSHLDLGSVHIEGKTTVGAGEWGTWDFVYTVGERPIPPGGGIEIVFNTSYPTNTWSIPQTHDPTAPGYTTAELSGAGRAQLSVVPVPERLQKYSLGCHIIRCTVEGATLFRRDSIRIRYGDTSGGSRGAQAQFMARAVEFPIYVDAEGGTHSKILNRASWFRDICRIAPVRRVATLLPKLDVVGGRAKSLKVVGPMIVRRGEEFSLRIVAYDAYSNRARDYRGTVDLIPPGGDARGFPVKYTFTEEDDSSHSFDGLRLPREGIWYITAVDPGNRIAGVSNPIRVVDCEVDENIYWGEIHGHTELSDGNGTLDEHYIHARDVALLDFAATTDHINFAEGEFGAEKWEMTKAKADEYNDPPRFVTLYGYEPGLSNTRGDRCHINIYCEDRCVPLVPTRGSDDFWESARKYNLLIVPHHTGYGADNLKLTDWSVMNPEFATVLEIFSAHGCSEYLGNPRPLVDQTPGSFFRDALARGYKFGAIASSDYHQAFTGQDIRLQEFPGNLNCRHFQYRTGYVAVLSKELSRRGVLGALRLRRCYATTGERIYIDFRIDGHPMGSDARAKASGKVEIEGTVAGTNLLKSVEVIRDGETLLELPCDSMTCALQYTDSVSGGISYYYLRVTQVDGEMAWSSPIWVNSV